MWLGLFILTFRGVFQGELLYRGPLYLYNVPLMGYFSESLAQGRMPLWTSSIFCGYPLVADINFGFFYPLQFLFYPLEPAVAVTLFILLHYAITGLGAWMYGRRIGLRALSAGAVALVWSFNAFLLDYHDQLQGLRTISWLPWILWALEGIPEKRGAFKGWRSALLAGTFLGLQFLGGHFQYSYYTYLLVGFYSVFQLLWAERRLRLLAMQVVACGMGLLLFCAQLFPTFELTKESWRSELTYQEVVSNREEQLTVPTAIKFLFRSYELGPYEHTQPGYFGVVALLLAFLAPLSKKTHWRFFAVVSVVSMLLAVGGKLPFHYLCYRFLPGFKVLKDPLRAEVLLIFSISVLSGLGLEALLGGRVRKPSFILSLGIPIVIGLFVWRMILRRESLFLSMAPALKEPIDPFFINFSARSELIPYSAIVAGYLALLYLCLRSLLSAIVAGGSLLICLAISLGLWSRYEVPSSQRDIFRDIAVPLRVLEGESGFFRKFTDSICWRGFEKYDYATRENHSNWVRLKLRWLERHDEVVGRREKARILSLERKLRTTIIPPKFPFWRNDAIIGNWGARWRVKSVGGYTTFPPNRLSRLARCSRQSDPFTHNLYPSFLLRAGLRKLLGVKYLLSIQERYIRQGLEMVTPEGKVAGSALPVNPEIVERGEVLVRVAELSVERKLRGMLRMPYLGNSRYALYEFLDEPKRAFQPSRVEFVQNPFAKVIAEEFHPQEILYLDSSYNGEPEVSAQPAYPETLLDTDGRIILEAPRDGWLVVSESYYPGWRSFSGPAEAQTVPADYAFLGMKAKRGECELLFDPPSVRYGVFGTLLGILILGGSLGFRRFTTG